jgi:hypothetical protein
MSFLTGTNVEVIAASAVAATAQTTFTTLQCINNGSNVAYLPIGFFNTNSVSKTIKVVADGIFSTTATPTLQLGVAIDTTLGTASGNTFLTGAITTPSGVTAAWWHFDCELTVSTFTEVTKSATGTTANIMGLGTLTLAASATSTTAAQGVYTLGSTSLVSVNAFSAQFVEIVAAWGTSSASNSITVERSTIYGCN